MKTVDVIIVGGGIAGCAMAWQCRLRGLRVLLIDHPRADSASRVAAGLVTPVTGSRFAVSWRWQDFFPYADTLYRRAEQGTGDSFWLAAPAWRAFTTKEEASFFEQKLTNQRHLFDEAEVQINAISRTALPLPIATHGGICMEPAGRLDVPVFLDATRRVQQVDGRFISVNLDIDQDLRPFKDHVEIPSLGVTSRWIVLCQGYMARTNRWFSDLPLHPARGDILLVRSHRLQLEHVLHHQGWIVPLGGDRFFMGATYDRHALGTCANDGAAVRWREELCRRWTTITAEGFDAGGAEILEHRIGVRPASYDRHPLIGPHPQCRHVWCFNGLGSKGSLMAPRLASWIIDAMTNGQPIDPCLLWSRRSAGT